MCVNVTVTMCGCARLQSYRAPCGDRRTALECRLCNRQLCKEQSCPCLFVCLWGTTVQNAMTTPWEKHDTPWKKHGTPWEKHGTSREEDTSNHGKYTENQGLSDRAGAVTSLSWWCVSLVYLSTLFTCIQVQLRVRSMCGGCTEAGLLYVQL